MPDLPARGSDANYCLSFPGDPHHMVSHSGGAKVRWVEICSMCGWIDTAALDGWADNAIKEALSKCAQRIAVSAETEPFAFVQASDRDLTIQEICMQALAGVEAAAVEDRLSPERRLQILTALLAEIQRYARMGNARES